MTTHGTHRGVAQDDPRNRDPIAFYRPQEVTRESARDLLSGSLPRASPAEIETRVDSVMTKDIIVAAPGDDINDALQKMHERGCRHLPVVQGGTLIGMISIRDLLQVDDDANRAKATFLRELVTNSPDYET